MLTISEINDLCQNNHIELTVISCKSYGGPSHWNFHVTAEFNDEGTKVEAKVIDPDLTEAINTAFARVFKLSREGFKFPIMLEGPAADVA